MRQIIEEFAADLRYAFRQLLKSPAFTTAAVATLALGIGANSAIYAVIDAALMRPLPYPNPDRLIIAWKGEPAEPTFYSFSYPRFRFFQEHALDFADIAVYDDEVVTFAEGGDPERVVGGRISANFLRVMGVKPQIGRDFTADEDRHGAPPVALLSDHLWRTRYHADPGVLGRKVRVDADEATVIGVLPAGVQFRNESVDIWRTRIVDTRTFAPASVQLGASYLTAIGRLHAGVSLRSAQARMLAIDAAYRRENPGNSDSDSSIYTDLLDREIFANMRTPLLVLWGAVGCLLLIACANVANLVLARALGRFREIAIRAALGAGRSRMIRQLITEGVLLSLAGGLAAIPVALWSTTALVTAIRRTMSEIPEPHPNMRVLLVTFVVATGIGVLFGLAPIALLLRGRLEGALHSSGRSSSASTGSIRLRQVVVAAQVALCVVLLSGAALLAQSLVRMSRLSNGHSHHLPAGRPKTVPRRCSTHRFRPR
ncbi:MAG TPA: ABC transporter permease [Bryobacteraceae bacterium]|nr:ABC transporter permease [Bryobacteraceae bacterium]